MTKIACKKTFTTTTMLAAFALGTTTLVATPGHVHANSGAAAASVAASSAAAAKKRRMLRRQAVAPNAKEAIRQRMPSYLAPYFAQCKKDVNVTETKQRDINNEKARDFRNCMKTARLHHSMSAQSARQAKTQFDMSARHFGYVRECRAKHSDWEKTGQLTPSQTLAVTRCYEKNVFDYRVAVTLKVLGGLGGATLFLWGVTALRRRFNKPSRPRY